MRRLWFLALLQPAGVGVFDVKSWRAWTATAVAVAGSIGGWKLLGYLYVEVIRDRIDRFIFDARRRHTTMDAELVLAAILTDAPAIDASRLASLRRHPAEFREILKDVLAEDYKAADERTSNARRALQLAEANASAIEGLSAAQLAQGQALKDVPHMAGVLQVIAEGMASFNTTIGEMNERQINTSREVGEILGTLRSYPNGEDRQNNRRQEDRERAAREFDHHHPKQFTEPTE